MTAAGGYAKDLPAGRDRPDFRAARRTGLSPPIASGAGAVASSRAVSCPPPSGNARPHTLEVWVSLFLPDNYRSPHRSGPYLRPRRSATRRFGGPYPASLKLD